MADKIISDLEPIETLNGDELLPVEDASGTFSSSINKIKDFILALVPFATTTAKGIIEIATNAEVAAGTDTERAIVPSALASLFGTSDRSTNGYERRIAKVGGAFVEVIMQWGTATSVAANSNVVVNLPITFPNAILNGNANFNSVFDSNEGARIALTSTSQITVRNDSATAGLNIMWQVIGY